MRVIAALIIAVFIVWLSYLCFEAIWTSDMPMWLKWLLLK